MFAILWWWLKVSLCLSEQQMQGKPHFLSSFRLMGFTSLMKCRMSTEFLRSIFPNSIQCGFKTPPRAPESIIPFRRLFYPLPLLLKTSSFLYYTVQSSLLMRCYSCSSKTSLYPGTLLLRYLPFQALLSNYFTSSFTIGFA